MSTDLHRIVRTEAAGLLGPSEANLEGSIFSKNQLKQEKRKEVTCCGLGLLFILC